MSSFPTDDDHSAARCVGVTVRTPAGASSAFAVEPDDTAGQLTVRAIQFFERHDLIEPGAFRIGLLRANTIVDLDLDTLLLPAGVVEGDVLHLLTSEPQVDGAHGGHHALGRADQADRTDRVDQADRTDRVGRAERAA